MVLTEEFFFFGGLVWGTVEYAEADCFFAFTNLMSEIRDFFIKSLDEAETGIGCLMFRLSEKLRLIDYSIHSHLSKLQLHPQYYSFRYAKFGGGGRRVRLDNLINDW